MTKDEQEKVVQAIAVLDQFAKSGRQEFSWYAQWQALWGEALQQIAALVVEEPFIDAEVKVVKKPIEKDREKP